MFYILAEQRNHAAAEAAAQIAAELGYDVDSLEAQDEHDLKPLPKLQQQANLQSTDDASASQQQETDGKNQAKVIISLIVFY